jgi:hypothetical protein
VSHHKQRTETNCLNCGNEVNGLYCSKCGQANVEVKLTFWQLITHFLSDLFHYDGKFLLSIKYLITRPGFLSQKWFEGKRASYLDPFKMYIFGSAIFFFFLSFVLTPSKAININAKEASVQEGKTWKYDSITMNGDTYADYEHYLRRQDSLPAVEKDGVFKRVVFKKVFRLNEIFKQQGTSAINVLIQLYIKYLPYMLFICLPFFAGILKLLYLRRKDYYYSDHGIFTMHLVLFFFIVNLVEMAIGKIPLSLGWLIFFINVAAIFHIYKSFKNFYKQSRRKTILKNLIFYILVLFVLMLVFLGGIVVLFFNF